MTKSLFITGASTGIGAATAKAAAKAGWSVGLFSRSQDKLEALAEEIGAMAAVFAGDATSHDDQRKAIDAFAQASGGLNAVFANAGRGTSQGGTEAGDPSDWDEMVKLNVMGALYTAHAALPHLQKTKGHYVVTGSQAGRVHLKGSIYGATKWFIHGFAGNLSQEMAEWGGRCTVIAPGMVDTPFFDEAKPDKLQPEDVADAVMHALDAPDRATIREIFLTPTH